ncbi:adhesion G-protein coupled receptor V1 [Eublepharis macularius]|uniref:Adhesion G-protein coupled receptor V1 n=1 Tax=Eublepharis macularius TaxID=481883 RepID=A0AA97JUX9_EUBMA|nr:adhesion G-protein coupled receptor V1 [Eublepharis macularius]
MPRLAELTRQCGSPTKVHREWQSGMPSAYSLVTLFLALSISFTSGETEVKFIGQTEFVVNETSTTVIRLVIERTGEPVNVTAIVSIHGENTGDFFDTYAAAYITETETNRTVYISVCDDDLPEADETFIFYLTLQKPFPGVKLGSPRAVTVTILSNDNAFGIISFNMPALITLNEPKGGNESVPLNLIREKGTYGTVTVIYEVEGAPDTPEEDLSPVRGNITFPPGTAELIYNLLVLDDQIPENDERFIIHLKSVEGGAEINASKKSVEIIIMKNDSPVRFTQGFYMVHEEDDIITIPIVRGKEDSGNIGPDEYEVSICYIIVTGNSTAHAQINLDFLDLQPNTTVIFPPLVHETSIKFKILDDAIPEIAETFHIVLLKDTLQGDAVLTNPSVVQVTIKPNDKPYGVLSINSVLFTWTVIIDEDQILRYEGITIVRNGGTHGNISVAWIITRNSSDPSPVTTDITPDSGMLYFAQGQMLASLPLNIINDDIPEEAEPFLLRILAHTIQGGAEVSEPAELLFYIQDSDDVYGVIKFYPLENQRIESSPEGRFLSLSFARQKGTVGDLKLSYTVLYIPAGPVDPERTKEGVLNISGRNILHLPEGKTEDIVKVPIRNDAFLQNGAHFLVQLEKVELLNIIPLVPSVSPRLGEIQNISLRITSDIANGEIGFISNLPLILHEPEDSVATVVSIPLHRDGTDGQATVFWSLKPSGRNAKAVTMDDITPFSGFVVFLSGQSDTVINITIKADDTPEMNETLTLSLDRVSVENQILKSGFTSRELIILENDDPGGVFEFAASSRGPYRIKEGESVELHIVRSRGTLIKQFLRYTVEPREGNEFYGSTGILEFKPGEQEIKITLLTRMDGIPELDEFYLVVLNSHGELPSKLGNATRVSITILKNDDPHGIIQFVEDGLTVTINESKEGDICAAVFSVIRNQGTFGNVTVSWAIHPVSSKDIFPEQGTIFFETEEFSKNITIFSLPDEVPEEMEVFTINLFNATGGSRMGNRTTATLQITKNDDPIYFSDPVIVMVQEGGIANFVVIRNGSDTPAASVLYATVNGGAIAKGEDFIFSEKSGELFFDVGIRERNITVFINDDDIPESDETFYIILFNSTGDTVVYGSGMATLIIEANDDPNGIFSLESIVKAVEEGKTNNVLIMRHRGCFGNVSVTWRLFENGSALDPGEEFYEVSGTVQFRDGEGSKPIILHAISDKIPEFNEFYMLKLVNATGGYPGPGGQLSETNLTVTVMIPFNDDPFGVFILDSKSQERELAEDVLSEDDMSYVANFTIWRQQGTFGDVRVGWEILSGTFREGLPLMIDCLLLGKFSDSVQSQPHMRRHHTGTDALYFSGEEDAFGIIESQFHISKNRTLANFTFSVWVIPSANSDGFIISKDNGNGTMYYGVKIITNESHVTVRLYYTPLQSNVTFVAKITVTKYLDENTWVHLLLTLDDGIIEFFIDGSLVPRGIKSLKGEAIADGPGITRVGAGINGGSRYKGLIQDMRFYERRLTKEEIYELHTMPAKADLHPISGYLEYRQGETNKSFIVSARDDIEEEGEEVFILKLISVHGGARISHENTTAVLRIQKSDNANGLFGFTGACIPEVSNEGSTVSCVVERTRGALDYVFVHYSISQIDSDGVNFFVDDFANKSGIITFRPFERSEVLNLVVLDDDIPELNEYFQVTLVSAVSGDGKIGSTPSSGASIDPEKETTYITIKASDHPYGLLQFSVGQPPSDSDDIILPATTAPHITVKEEIGHVSLLVIRAQGLLGMVLVQYRTISLTAFSPQDYQGIADTLEFLPGERYKYIIINITDNSIPELEKAFKVELLNPNGKVAELFSDGSGSGDGNVEFFLPAVLQHASLGTASHIIVTIEASDDAHGVFEFSAESLSVNGTEPEDGDGTITLKVIRNHGALSQITLQWLIVPEDTADLVATSGNISFNIEQRKANLVVQVLHDDIPELDKIFSVWIIDVSCGRLGVYTNATLTVLANDDPYGLLIFSEKNRPIKVEEETKNITLTIARLKGLLGVIMVTYRTMSDENMSLYLPLNVARATREEDYLPIFGSIIFAANESEATIELPILDDNEPERSESVFVELLDVALVEGAQYRPILNSPRLGPKGDTVAHVIINANDDAFGTLQLSVPAVRVAENYIGPIINVTRTGGLFSDVSVKFKAVPITATAGEDYSVASSDVLLLEGETSKAVPIYIINDINPEVEESLLVQLLNQTTGGALVGGLTQAVITIEASDDPYGSFVFQIAEVTVEEPESNTVMIDLPIIRNAGTLGNVTVLWVATINGQHATSDLLDSSGNIHFSPGETMQKLTLEILADDDPEIQEMIRVELTQASNGGTIGPDRVANVIIPANDKPYGTVCLYHSVYRVQEPLEKSSVANITVTRSGGRFGQLQIFFSTSEIDVVTLAIEQGLDVLSYYEAPMQGTPDTTQMIKVNISLTSDSLYTCATLCLKEHACPAFAFSSAFGIQSCFWVAMLSSPVTNDSGFWIYKKNLTSVSTLFSTQAIANSDYESVTEQWVIMAEDAEFTNLTVNILPDDFPELDETFIVSLLKVELMNISASAENQPTIGLPNTSTVVILMNGDAFGVFVIYSISPNTTENGLYVEVQEWPLNTVQLVIHRTDGSLGQVLVEWSIAGGTATPNLDFIGEGESLIFAEGETKKAITLTILDDSEPEDDESIIISLTHTEGGSRILPSSDTVMVVILANDNVAGVLSFQTASRSVIGHEGDFLQFHVLRTGPGTRNCTVEWKIVGHRAEQNFENVSGIIFFLEGSLNATFYVHLLDDVIPEEKEEYQVILHNVRTQGVSSAGAAVLDNQGYEAVLTIEASDEPHGVLNFASSSRVVLVQEENKTVQLFINREFGSLGIINVTYATVPGLLGLKNQTEMMLAEPGADFISALGSFLLGEGETSATINVTVLEDDEPEMQEFFMVNLTSVELIINPLTSVPPRLDIHGLSAQIIIDANDGARGVIGWQTANFEISEQNVSLTLVAFRDRGSYGNVSLFLYAQNLEAQLGLDFNITSRTLSFADGERYKYVDIMIFDDEIPEGDERFQLILTNPSLGLELGETTTATVTILTNDDGHGVLSFNNSEHFFLREQSALQLMESVAVLTIIREPPQGTFGTVTVQYLVHEINSSEASVDLTPSQGYIVLEEGIRFKTLHISAILDTEPEMDEHFIVTLFSPTGGARLGIRVETFITVLQNQAPLGLFSIFPISNRTNSVIIEEANATVYLEVSRSNGLNTSVSVEWETLSDTAFGIKGGISVLSMLQSFVEEPVSSWCFFTSGESVYGILLRTHPAVHSSIYQWRGVFVPIEDFNIQNPQHCMAFQIDGSSYIVISHSGTKQNRPSKTTVYSLTNEIKLVQIQDIVVPDSSDMKYFTYDQNHYLIIASYVTDSVQIFLWNNGIFVFHHEISMNGAIGLALFPRGGTLYLVVVPSDSSQETLLYEWSDNKFRKFHEVPVSGITQVKTLTSESDVYLIFAKDFLLLFFTGTSNTCEIFVWETGQSFFRHFQSLSIKAVNEIHTFLPSSGLVHVLFAGKDKSVLYSWNSEINQFSPVLEAPSANHFTTFNVRSLNSNKSLIVLSGDFYSYVYELTAVSNQSDFIPSSGELIFKPGDMEVVVAINIFDDTVPEEEEFFRVWLKNPKGGAEIGPNGYVTIIVPSNDDAHGVVAFAQNSLFKQFEEMEQDTLITLNVERLIGTYGRITVQWVANGSISDIFPTSGVITFSEGQALSTITLTVLSDVIPEIAERVIITLTHVSTVGIQDPKRGAIIDPDRAKAILTILPNDSPYGIVGWHAESLFVKVVEPQDEPTIVTLHVLREQGFVGDICVQLISKPIFSLPFVNQAMENEDYQLENKMVIMAENVTMASVSVVILPDTIPELQEGFVIDISNVQLLDSSLTGGQPSVKRIGLEIAEITIEENDDPRGIFNFNATKDISGTVAGYEVPPPENILKLPVVRKAGKFGSVHLYWKATPATASLDDFTPPFGNLTFADGQETGVIEITIIDDDIVEFLEMFSVTLLGVTGGARLGDDVLVAVTIPPNDSPVGVFGFKETFVTVKEPQSTDDPAANVFLTVYRSQGGQGEVRLIWILEETAKYDLTPLNGTLLFAEMELEKTIHLQAIQDGLLEANETYNIQLVSTDGTEISPISGIATITLLGDPGASGVVGVASSSAHILIGEPIGRYNGTAFIGLVRGPGIFGEVTVSWNITPPLQKEFAEISGTLIMRDRQSAAVVLIQALDDSFPEEKHQYQFHLTGISEGGIINESANTAYITVAASDLPYGRFAFSQELLQITEEEKWANITIFRSHGHYGQVHLWCQALNGTAMEGMDFTVMLGELKFEPNETVKTLVTEIHDDDLPEGPEDFSIEITKVELLGSGFDFTIKEHGLQVDQPPEIGNASVVRIIISKSDNAEGIIEFDPLYTSLQVEEDIGLIMIPVLRRHGNYGYVTADFISRSISALPGGVDYSITNNSVTFNHGQNQSFINVLIIDDDEREYDEQFAIHLIGATGGAVLGLHLVSQITISKSDSPHGTVRFLNQSQIILPNPNVSLTLSLVLERTGSLVEDTQVNWDILGPNSEVVLPALNSDIGDPVNGSFYFEEGEEGLRSINLEIYPPEDVEVQETYIIRLIVLKGEIELDPKAASITLIIQKFGDPNGIVQFTPESLLPKYYEEPSESDGPLKIVLFITRIQGTTGNITVRWELSSDSDTTDDFLITNGSVIILDQQRTSEIVISLLPDDVPEIDEDYVVQLTSVEGGADVDWEKSTSRFTVFANDEPHGVFALYSEKQSVLVEEDLSRHIQINVTRSGGTFADVIVEYQISSSSQEQLITPANTVGHLVVKEGSSYGVKTVPICPQVFLFLGLNFTLELNNVSLFNVHANTVPKILQTAISVSLPVPREAANSQVAFDSLLLRVRNITTGVTQALIIREGVYGSVTVIWTSGYPPGTLPEFLLPGNITPASGSATFSHGEPSRAIVFHVTPNPSIPEAFAVHLSELHSNVSGGVQLRLGFTVAEIEPMGIFQFAPNSRHILVQEDVQVVRLYVQRLFGYQSNFTKLFYQTIAGSAKPLEDFESVYNGELVFGLFQTEAMFEILIIDDSISEEDEIFFVNLTSVEVLPTQELDLMWNPRLNPELSVASIVLLANDIHHGILSIGPSVIYTEEDTNNSMPNTVLIHIKRTRGVVGNVSVAVKTFGGISAQSGIDTFSFETVSWVSNLTWATEGVDFEELAFSVMLLDGEGESLVSVRILDDDEPEGQEFFYVVLSDPEGGALISQDSDEYGFAGFATIVIKGNDLQNGVLGFTGEAQSGLLLDEDSEKREVLLIVTRQPNRAFEEVKISWRVTFNETSVILQKHGVNLANELVAVLGVTTCNASQTKCIISIEIKPDNVPEFETAFFVELYNVSTGAALNDSARFAYILVPESDSPRGLIYFAVGSRLAVAHKKTTFISLQVVRDSSTALTISIGYRTQELTRPEAVGRITISPAISGQDFTRSEGTLFFEPGQRNTILDIMLTPETGSLNPFPKRFQVVLFNPTGGARVDDIYGIANITIVSDSNSQAVWGLADQLYQPIDETILNRVLQLLNIKVVLESTEEQLAAVMYIIDKVMSKVEKHPLTNINRNLLYEILCALINPKRKDTQGYSFLADITEKFAFSLPIGEMCGSLGERGKTILDHCPYIVIMAHSWYPQQINGHIFYGKDGDFIRIPERLLEISDSSHSKDDTCWFIQFTEYSSQQWFITGDKGTALKNKIFSLSLKSLSPLLLKDKNDVTYRIHSPDSRIVPHKSLCLLWNEAAESWLTDSQFCKVIDESSNYVECSCSHLSLYAAYAQTDTLSSYNEAFFSSGFICISGLILAIFAHLFCTRASVFAAKLLTHMMVACLGTQVSFLASAYVSQQLSEESCSALGAITHYLYLCQFSWMLIQAVNFWYVLVMNDEHTERRYLMFFLLGWGLPAFVVVLLLIILRGIYHHNVSQIYGLVHNDLCFIPNTYAALFTAVLVPLMCLVVVFVVFIHAYQVTPQWKAYDDVFRGRTNAAEIPLILYLFALISITWFWGGVHMAYRHLWMLVFFVIFNCLQGLYVFVVYFILHNQLCCPVKASYTVEMNGHTSPGSAFFTHGSGMLPAAEEISKSTQNLISALEEMPADWEGASLRPASQASAVFKQSPQNGSAFTAPGGFSNSSLVADEESQEFDDLIFALKTGAGLTISDTDSCHGSQDGSSMVNSQIVELRRIPIADTHL